MNCDPLARWYRWMEYLGMGRALERRREEFLREAAEAREVLLLGDGDGRFLCRLAERNPAARIDTVDASGEMLSAARARLGASAVKARPGAGRGTEPERRARVEFHHADARSWEAPAGRSYDLVVTHFFLDCFGEAELAELIPRLAARTRPGARWIVSEFHQPASGPAAWRARAWIRGLYLLFGWTTGLRVRRLPEYRPLLERAGFRLVRRTTANAGLLVSELWQRDCTELPGEAPPSGSASITSPVSSGRERT